jgi:DNA/RNA endonuclease YhcR with UshA esterase domain
MSGLLVKSVYTTDNEESSSNGAMTLTCELDGKTISVRTIVLRNAAGELVTAGMFENKTIDVKGLVDLFDGTYQVKVFSIDDITIY